MEKKVTLVAYVYVGGLLEVKNEEMDTINWEDLYVQLFAYTDNLLKAKTWFRKGKIDSYLKGKQVHDYVADAIEKFLKNPGDYDPSKRTLTGYLKLHIIRTLVWNDANRPENFKTLDIDLNPDNSNSDDQYQNIEALLPYANAYFDQQIDHDKILKEIRSEVIEDSIVNKIFEGYCLHGLKRREILIEYNMDSEVYDNGMKRLKTVIKKTAKKYDLIQPK